jgi:hypothetical protein
MRQYTCVCLLPIVVSASCVAQTRPPAPACEMAPVVREALNALPRTWDYHTPLGERMKPIRALVERSPADPFVQQQYQDSFRRLTNLSKEFDRAFAVYHKHPTDPLYRYLEARLTASFDAAKAEGMFNQVIAERPEFPWSHSGIAELTDRSGARDTAKAEQHLRAFLSACPSALEGYALLRTVDNPEMIRNGAARFRQLLEAKLDYVSLPYWRYLWDQEFRAAPKEQQEGVRQSILEDAASLRRILPTPSRDWYSIFDYAATLTKDADLRKWLEETTLRQFPGSIIAVNVERAQWSREHPNPGRGAKPEELKAYSDLYSGRQEDLAERHPGDYNVIYDRWQSVRGSSVPRPIEERLAIADAFSAMVRRSPDAGSMTPPLDILLADLYVNWRVRLEQVPLLIQSGFQVAELVRLPAEDG